LLFRVKRAFAEKQVREKSLSGVKRALQTLDSWKECHDKHKACLDLKPEDTMIKGYIW